MDSIPKRNTGRAKIDGIVQVQINKQTEDDSTAGVADGDATRLKGGEAGARVLWADPGTGTQWALVRIENTARPIFAIVTDVGKLYSTSDGTCGGNLSECARYEAERLRPAGHTAPIQNRAVRIMGNVAYLTDESYAAIKAETQLTGLPARPAQFIPADYDPDTSPDSPKRCGCFDPATAPDSAADG